MPEMLAYRFSFFYAATAIAYSEIFSAEPEETSVFMKSPAQGAGGVCESRGTGPTLPCGDRF